MSILFPEINYFEVDNNFKILFMNAGKNIYTCQMIIDVGSRIETTDELGLAHFFEHMIFKGKIDEKDIVEQLDYLGCHYNASTSHTSTNYHISGSVTHYQFITETILQMLFSPQFPEDKIQNEINVVLEELMMYADDNDRKFYEESNKILYKDIDNLLTRPIIGTEEKIRLFTREKLIAFHREKYLTNEKIMVILGNVDHKKIINMVESKFSKVKPWLPIYRSINRTLIIPHKNDIINGINYIELPVQQCLVKICFRSINNYSSWIITQNILANILSSGSSSRLFNLLRNELGLTYFQSAYGLQYDDHGLFIVHFGVKLEGVKVSVERVINELLNFKDVTIDEFTKVKNNFETNILYGTENITDVGITAINYIVDKKDPEKYKNIRKTISCIKEKHINNLAKEIFQKDNMTIIIGGKLEEIEKIDINIP
jgi:predicted Zn-dependent peptidase